MENIDYRAVYRIQDRVLKVVFGADTTFYLTGGTCLNRFFLKNGTLRIWICSPMRITFFERMCGPFWMRLT